MRDTLEGMAPALIGMCVMPVERPPGKSNPGNFLSHRTAPGPPGVGPAQLCTHAGGLHTEDPHTQHSSLSSGFSRQGTPGNLYSQQETAFPLGQGSWPTQARPFPYILVGSKSENKDFPPALGWGGVVGVLSSLRPAGGAPGTVTGKSLPLLLKAHGQVIK